MKTFQIILRDVNHVYIETYIIQSEMVVTAIKIARSLFAKRHPKLANGPIETVWSEAFTEGANRDLTTVKAFTSNPLPPKVGDKRKPLSDKPVQDKWTPQKKSQPSQKENEGSGIFTTINGKAIELSLVPME